MYWKNFMISYSGKDMACIIHELKYDSNFVSEEQIDKDLLNNFSNIKRLVVELESGEFDDYANHLSWDGTFYGIPAKVCQEIIDEWYESQKLTPEQEAAVDARYHRPLNLDDLKDYEYRVDRDRLVKRLLFHDKTRKDVYHLPPIGIEYYKNILDNFHYNE